jgi:SAM-dependent methyltransferase
MGAIETLGRFHRRYLHPGRVANLLDAIEPLIPTDAATLLDVGCGDGRFAMQLGMRRPGLSVHGVDVLIRPETHIPVVEYDGRTLPQADKSVDITLLVDVLHHADDATRVLAECARVTRQVVIVKDHIARNKVDNSILKAMDWVGNRHSGVALPYRYPSPHDWQTMFADAGLRPQTWTDRVPVYGAPVSWIAGRDIHLLTTLVPLTVG